MLKGSVSRILGTGGALSDWLRKSDFLVAGEEAMAMREHWWWLAEVAAGAAVGLPLGFLEDAGLGVVFGVLVWVVFLVLRETARIRSEMFGEVRRVGSELDSKVAEWERKALDLPQVLPYLTHLTPADPYFAQQVRASMDELGSLARGAAGGELVLRPRSIQQACIEFLKQADTGGEVFAASYVNPEFFWCTPEGALYRQHCIDLTRKGVKMTRVFLIPARANHNETKCVNDEIAQQKGSGVRVKRVLESSLPPESRKDFLLIQGKYVAYLGVGGRGDLLEELKVCNSKTELEKAGRLAETIERLSEEC